MAYENMAQVLALSKAPGKGTGLEIKPFPKLAGKLAQIDPEGVALFNEAAMQWVAQLRQDLEKAIAEASNKT